VTIDVDCVLEQDAILKLAKPFLEQADKRVIAAGGVLRIANGCEVEGGRLVKIYCGGYNNKTVGEDMELLVRMRRYMEEQKEPYKVSFIPDPLCWTEAPATYKTLGIQRNRWTRGTIETLQNHKKMFFNPKYHILGLVSYPYWAFFEFGGPIIETIGYFMFIVFCVVGMISWSVFFIMISIFSIGVLYSLFAILMEVLTYNQYKQKRDLLRLALVAIAEPFVFHPFVVFSAIKGNFDFLRKRHNWGNMTRQGFTHRHKTKS
jgi:cellulose synthase/poly-beta-1,6-N-acetylglucosamine synthase-like glycosyltransferase